MGKIVYRLITVQEIDGGVVEVHIPEVKILDTNIDLDSFGEPVTDTGLFTWITAEEKMQAVASAQDNMRETAQQNELLFSQAEERARQTIAGYVQNVGESVGENFLVRWV